MVAVLDLSGKNFGRLTVMCRAESSPNGKARWVCKCECGTEKVIFSSALVGGITLSCGCLRNENSKRLAASLNRTHGMSRTRIFHVWDSMLQRCGNPNHKSFPDYGGRGISVCERWKKFENFFSDMGDPGQGFSIDRIDHNGNYEPGNVRWATSKTQGRNKRSNTFITVNGETQPLAYWCEKYSINKVTAMDRIKRGWSPELAFETPARSYVRKGHSSVPDAA